MDKVNIRNKKASFDYYFIKEFVAGIQLLGSEVKSIREGKISLVDSYCFFKDGELFVRGVNIAVGKNAFQHDPLRERKLLLNRSELNKLEKGLEEGTTIVIKSIFSNDKNLIKAAVALARGKKLYDKRDSIKDKDTKREMERYE